MPALALGYAIGRLGCFLNGCCYGAPTDLPWAFRFHDPPVTGPLTAPSHPTQIYASLINLGIFAALWAMAMRKTRPGQVFFAYLALYSIYRFGIEFLRKGYTAKVWLGGLTQAQIGSLVLLVLAVALYAWASRAKSAAPEKLEVAHPRKREVANKGAD
jgi:phosphatidylglycerol:prolipoprotein diacylglycerol transferase